MQSEQQPYNFTEQEMKQYGECPEVNYQGGHLAGLGSCVFCAEIFRRYRVLNGETIPTKEEAEEHIYEDREIETEEQAGKQTKKFISSSKANQNDDDDELECGKLACMKTGFCICD